MFNIEEMFHGYQFYIKKKIKFDDCNFYFEEEKRKRGKHIRSKVHNDNPIMKKTQNFFSVLFVF